MGTFFHPITLTGPSGASETIEALVDTGAMFAVFPASLLRRLGVQALDNRRYQGRLVGQVEAELAGERGWPMVTFGAETDQARIGRHTLDSFILDVDPRDQCLIPKTFHLIEHL